MIKPSLDGRPADLTQREQQIFHLIAEGQSPADIASQLYVTTATVNGAMLRVRDKLGAKSNAHAILIAERHHPQLLRDVIARHGTWEGAQAHLSSGTPLCWECEAVDLEEGPKVRVLPFQPGIPKTLRLKPHEPVECGNMQAVRRHRARGDKISELTCGCREAYAAYHREYRSRQKAA